jgi:hypothetical protein
LKESALVQQALAYLRLKGHFVWRNNTGATRAGKFNERFIRYGLVGSSDVLGCAKDGKLIAIECKIKPRKPTEYQLGFLDEVRKRGGYAILAYDLSDIEKVL